MKTSSKSFPNLNSLMTSSDTRVWMLPSSTSRLKLVRITRDRQRYLACHCKLLYVNKSYLSWKVTPFSPSTAVCCSVETNDLWVAEVCPGKWEDYMPQAPQSLCGQIHRELSLSVFPKLTATVGKVITQNGDTRETWNTKVGNEKWCFGREIREQLSGNKVIFISRPHTKSS